VRESVGLLREDSRFKEAVREVFQSTEIERERELIRK